LQEAGFVSTEKSKIDLNKLKLIVDAVRGNISCMSQIVREAEIFFKDVAISENHVEFLSSETSQSILSAFYMELQKLNTLSPEIFRDILKTVQKETKVNGKGLYLPIRIALTGREHGPELYSIADILGINVCKAKIGRFLLVKNK
jgi:glutamyl/glutaminyl-tRNA synthetase